MRSLFLLAFLLLPSAPAAEPERPLDVALTSRFRGYFYNSHEQLIAARTGIPATFAYGEIDRRMTDAAAPPDLAELGIPGGLAHLDRVLDLRPFLAEDGLDPAQFVPESLAPWRRGEAILAIPRDLTVTCLLWSAARAQEAGVDPARVATWEDLAAAGRTWRARTGRPYLAFPKTMAGLITLLHQDEALTVDAAGQPVLTGERAVAVLAWYVRAIWGPEPIATIVDRGEHRDRGVTEGDPLVWVMPAWDYPSYGRISREQRLALAQAPLPAWRPGGHRAVLMYGHALAIHRSCPQPRRAWALIRGLMTDPVLNAQSQYEQRLLNPWMPAWDLPEMGRPHPGFTDPQQLRFHRRLAADLPAVDPRTLAQPLYPALTEAAAALGARLQADPALDVTAAAAAELAAVQQRLRAGATP